MEPCPFFSLLAMAVSCQGELSKVGTEAVSTALNIYSLAFNLRSQPTLALLQLLT